MEKTKKQKAGYRYPGVTPFTRDQSAIFFGRERDTKELYRLIRREAMVVLYGKSGLGKSSLLNAGIIPIADEEGEYKAQVIRFGAWTENSTETPLSVSKRILSGNQTSTTLLDRLLEKDDSLWYYAKNQQINAGDQSRPLLLFDQFEELFSYPEQQIEDFIQELAELLNTGIPLRFRRRLDTVGDGDFTEEEEDLLEMPLATHVLLAIRSDRMHLLDRLKDYLPNILRYTYELRALNKEDARDAIILPAAAEGDFKTPTFEYSPAALDKLITFLEDPQDQRVEGILLQMLCEHYERRQVEARGITQLDVQEIGDPKLVVSKYYHEKVESLPSSEQSAARRLIEDGLVSEGEAMRLSLHESFIAQEFRVGKELLEQLVDSRLLRSEPFLRGGYTYELSHDRLVPAVVNARSQRREEEARLEAERQQKELEKARRRVQTLRGLLAIAVLSLLASAYFAFDANQKKTQAEKAQTEAQDNLIRSYESEINRYQGEIEVSNTKLRSYDLYGAGEDVIKLENQKIDQLNEQIDSLIEEIKLLEQ